jgi:hypothetical protein
MNRLAFSTTVLLALAGGLFLPGSVPGQTDGVPIETQTLRGQQRPLVEQAARLRDAGRLLNKEDVAKQLSAPVPGPIQLPKARKKELRGRDVAERARQGYVRVGWFFLCQRCEDWHLDAAGGYAIARDAVATCHHCVEPQATMRQAYLMAIDSQNNVLPVTAVLAKSRTMDAALLRVEGGRFLPLPLNDDVAPGDTAYCFSEPLGQSGYFSVGIVNRFYWRPGRSGAPGSVEELKALRLNVSTDWAPGSSGAAVLDASGNAIGHVSTMATLSESAARAPRRTPRAPAETPRSETEAESPAPRAPPRDRFGGAVLLTLHEAVPARSVLALARTLPGPSQGQAAEAPKAGRR